MPWFWFMGLVTSKHLTLPNCYCTISSIRPSVCFNSQLSPPIYSAADRALPQGVTVGCGQGFVQGIPAGPQGPNPGSHHSSARSTPELWFLPFSYFLSLSIPFLEHRSPNFVSDLPIFSSFSCKIVFITVMNLQQNRCVSAETYCSNMSLFPTIWRLCLSPCLTRQSIPLILPSFSLTFIFVFEGYTFSWRTR